MERVRRAAVAGGFYPAEPAVLDELVTGLLAEVREPTAAMPKAVIAPHAGFQYSGPIAASAYATLRNGAGAIERVVLLGPCHRVYLAGLAASGAEAFETPLGRIPLDRGAIERALELPQVRIHEAAHASEHSLEVQLPFLQKVLGEFSLAPFAVGDASDDEVSELLELLWGGRETLIVISSDLSHYYDYERAHDLDARTSHSIEALRPNELGDESACGRVPVRGLLVAAARHGLRARTLDLRNSGDTAGSRREVVGYGAYHFA